MHVRAVFHLLSYLMLMLAGCMAATLLVSYANVDPVRAVRGMGMATALTLVLALGVWHGTRGPVELTRKDGILIVVFGWLVAVGLSMLPFLFCEPRGTISLVDALFETVSGFTTTGASILTDLETQPRGILFWRSMTHFLGGMGILVLCVAIIPFLGVGGMQIYRAEAAGPSKDRLTPRIASTAKLLWSIYLGMNLLLAVLLRLSGMDWFDAVNHAMATMATGGFSTRSASIAAYNSATIEAVITVFMVLASLNFALHFRAIRGQPLAYARDPECRFFFAVWLLLCGGMTLNLLTRTDLDWTGSLRAAFFTGSSILSTTGFVTADFDLWPTFSKMLLVTAMFVGGCAGSTAGGIKIIRMFVLLKKMTRELRIFLRPQAVYPVKIGRRIIDPAIISSITVFFFIFTMTFTAGCIGMSFFTEDIVTAVSAVIAALGNIGPGLGAVGPTQTYTDIHDAAKVLLAGLMLLGRLELYTILVILMPGFWKR